MDGAAIVRDYRGVKIGVQCALAIVVVCCVAPVGCQRRGTATSQPGAQADPASPAGVLTSILRDYAERPRHQELSVLTLAYDGPHGRVVKEDHFHFDFARPNQIHLVVKRAQNKLQIVSDGRSLWVAVDDPSSNNLGQQVVQRPAPDRLGVGELYAATELLDPARPEQMISLLLGLPVNLQLTPLAWLTGDPVMARVIADPQRVSELEPGDLALGPCRRLRVETAGGPFVFWVQTDQRRILRVDLPTSDLFAEQSDSRPANISLTWQVKAFGDSDNLVSSGFKFDPSSDAQFMQYFVMPPVTQLHPSLGKSVPIMQFENLQGRREASSDWRGKVAVLLWVDDQEASRRVLPLFEDAAALYSGKRDDVAFRVVDVSPVPTARSSTPNDFAPAPVPRLLDRAAVGHDVLRVAEAPTLVVLNSQHELSWFEVGANPQLDQELVQILDPLLAGSDLAADVRRAAEAEQQRYEQQLTLARRPEFADGTQSASKPAASDMSLAERKPFAKFEMTSVWQSSDAVDPGTMALTGDLRSQDAKLLVVDSMRELVSLSLAGKLIGRTTLPIDDNAYVTEIRTAVDAAGRRWYLMFSKLGRFVYLCDERLQLRQQYPATDVRHSGIQDVLLDDLDADGQLEAYIAFAEQLGCHRIDLNGRAVWRLDSLPAIGSLAIQRRSQPPHLLLSGSDGRLVPVAANGQAGAPLAVGRRTIHQLFAAQTSFARPTQMLGLSYTVEGRLIALGLDERLNEVWSYGLPAGLYGKPLQIAQWIAGPRAERAYWLLIGPDGSIHLVRDDGQVHDSCNQGLNLRGVIGCAHGDSLRLFIAADTGVTALDVKVP